MIELPQLPPGETWEGLHRRFLQRLSERGLCSRSSRRGIARGLIVTAANAVLLILLFRSESWPLRAAFLILAGPIAMQTGMLGHELGHAMIRRTAEPLGLFFMTFLAGQANGHWLEQHHLHHLRMQDPLGDPDMDIGAFSLSEEAARKKISIWALTTRLQPLLFWPLATMMAFSIRFHSLVWVMRNLPRTIVQLLALAAHMVLWVVIPAQLIGWTDALVDYGVMTWSLGMCMMATFYWNHIGRPVFAAKDDVPFFARCYLGSRSLPGGPLLTPLFGGLNYHVEHHLAPGVALENLESARGVLREMLEEVGLELRIWSWGEAMREVHRHLVAMSKLAGRREKASLPEERAELKRTGT